MGHGREKFIFYTKIQESNSNFLLLLFFIILLDTFSLLPFSVSENLEGTLISILNTFVEVDPFSHFFKL